MPLNYENAREYILSQPFVETIGFYEILRFNPYALPTESTPLDELESRLGKLKQKSVLEDLKENPILKNVLEGLFDHPEGTFDLYLDSVPTEDYQPKELRTVSAGLTSNSFFSEITNLGMHFTNPREFLYLCHELRLKQEIAERLIQKYNLTIDALNGDNGLVVNSKENPEEADINSLLNFCMAYHGVVNGPQFKRKILRLTQNVNSRLESLSENLISDK